MKMFKTKHAFVIGWALLILPVVALAWITVGGGLWGTFKIMTMDWTKIIIICVAIFGLVAIVKRN